MNRTLVVAKSEFLAIVRTKAFIIGILMAPIMIGLSIGFQVLAQRRADVDDHAVAVIDRTGQLFDALQQAADDHNAKAGPAGKRTGPLFTLTRVDLAGREAADVKVDLSSDVRHKRLFAFVDIPAGMLERTGAPAASIEYYTETPSYETLPDWLQNTLGNIITTRRFKDAAVDPSLVAMLTKSTRVSTLGLLERKADGTVTAAKAVNGIQTVVVPFGLTYLLFIALMTTAPQLLTAVIEEKMSRISEVLLASITPFQLMMGKLIGVAGVAVLLALVYFAGIMYVAFSAGMFDLIPLALMGWFVVFLLCAVFIFGSVFIAVGSACSDIKDSQSMMQPIMIFLLLPIIGSTVVLRAPNSTIAVVASLFPTSAPFLMLMRLALTPAPPLWQVALSIGLTVGTAMFLVWAASRIFRVGLLMQGKPPNLPELLRWIRQ